MTTLHLGVVDVAYTGDDGAGKTTGDVAGYLEDRYHIMRVFIENHEKFVGDALADAVAGAIESMMQGKPGGALDLKGATGKIEERFRDYLSSGELARMLPVSQQSQAAAAGVNHRKITPYAKKNKARAAFIDTGLYQASFRAWVD